MPGKAAMTEAFNTNKPGKPSFVQRDTYGVVKRVLKDFMPEASPGLTQDEMALLVIEHVSGDVLDDRTKAGWRMETVQLDLEAKHVMIRGKTKPLRRHYETRKKEFVPEATDSREIKDKSMLDLPEAVNNTLLSEGLLDAYDERPFYQRNDYLHWIAAARREETRNKRIRQMLGELRTGNLYMNMEYTRART